MIDLIYFLAPAWPLLDMRIFWPKRIWSDEIVKLE